MLTDKWQSVIWAAGILLLPFTSLPLIANVAGTTMVAAPSAAPLFLLFLLWFIYFVLKRGTFPPQIIPLLAFGSIAVAASAYAVFLEIPRFQDATILTESATALVTLAAGIIFYTAASTWPQSQKRIKFTFALFNLSGLVIILWSLLQGVYIYAADGNFPEWMHAAQNLFSVRRLFNTRITGFAFEPSWLAHQLNMVYLPYWLASSLQRYSAHSFRVFGLRAENFLLAGGLVTLIFSFSRIGWLAFILVIAYLCWRGLININQRLRKKFFSRYEIGTKFSPVFAAAFSATTLVIFLIGFIGAITGIVQVAGKYDPRFNNFFNRMSNARDVYDLSNRLAFAERVVYWGVGWEVFNDHSLIGVGLGNAGFFFPEKVPALGTRLREINDLLYQTATIPNIKNLWGRLLAETGILGMAVFGTWLYVLWKTSKYLQTSNVSIYKTIGQAGIFVILGLLVEGFSIDTFALPYWWISLGLITAASVSPDVFGTSATV